MNESKFTVFHEHGKVGLCHDEEPLLAPEFEGIWEIGHGYWGARQGRRYLVVAPSGARVVPVCVLPAFFAGYRMLDLGEQLAYAAQGPVRALADLPRDHAGLRLHLGTPYAPVDWWAEQVLASLWAADTAGNECLALPGRSRNLVLHMDGTWVWEPRTLDEARQVVCGTGQAGEFGWVDNISELVPPDAESLLRWQVRCERVAGVLGAGDDSLLLPEGEARREHREADAHEQELDKVLKAAGITGLYQVGGLDFAGFVPYDESDLDPAVVRACYAHLGQYVELDEAGREAAAELVQLAWLWENGFVHVDAAEGWAIVDARYGYEGDYDPILQEDATPLQLYSFYALAKLGPLLRRDAA